MPSHIIVGKVYANWCKYCQLLKPEWAKLKNMIPKDRVQFIEIEESEAAKRAQFERKSKTTLNVNGYPTIFKIHTNKPVEYYTGPRNAQAMRSWIFATPIKKKTFKRPLRTRRRTQKSFLGFL